jgi:hypothetical protein
MNNVYADQQPAARAHCRQALCQSAMLKCSAGYRNEAWRNSTDERGWGLLKYGKAGTASGLSCLQMGIRFYQIVILSLAVRKKPAPSPHPKAS